MKCDGVGAAAEIAGSVKLKILCERELEFVGSSKRPNDLQVKFEQAHVDSNSSFDCCPNEYP